jgi:hypothetical protein
VAPTLELSGATIQSNAIAMAMLAHESMHETVLDELGDFLRAEMIQAVGSC